MPFFFILYLFLNYDYECRRADQENKYFATKQNITLQYIATTKYFVIIVMSDIVEIIPKSMDTNFLSKKIVL